MSSKALVTSALIEDIIDDGIPLERGPFGSGNFAKYLYTTSS